MEEIVVFWFRRDLRLEDNTALSEALKQENPVLPIFIFDEEILSELEINDPRITFIYEQLLKINLQLKKHESSIQIHIGKPIDVFKKLVLKYRVKSVYANRDYEPYALQRDREVAEFLAENDSHLYLLKDQVIFETNEIMKPDGKPYTVFTPYKNKWLSNFQNRVFQIEPKLFFPNFLKINSLFPTIHTIGFEISSIKVKAFDFSRIEQYESERNFPYIDSTSYLSPHLRFGTISIRKVIKENGLQNSVFLSELIWREFFMQILYHFPKVLNENFKQKYNGINWRNDELEFEKWTSGNTGYPLVDAGMRQLSATGYMHNRVRMITAGFLCKHLLIDWKWGESYFAQKLLDYELSANNGNWQWAAGTGCDAAPYFRIFNPIEQMKKFDSKAKYVQKWVPEYGSFKYPEPMVEHKFARERALRTYKEGLAI